MTVRAYHLATLLACQWVASLLERPRMALVAVECAVVDRALYAAARAKGLTPDDASALVELARGVRAAALAPVPVRDDGPLQDEVASKMRGWAGTRRANA